MTEEQALKILWDNKDWMKRMKEGTEEKFLYATTTSTIEHVEYDNDDYTDPKGKHVRTIPAGTTVLVTMYSRMGDVGIRADRLVPPSHGYATRVFPGALKDWREQP
jgi:hypothetical protein